MLPQAGVAIGLALYIQAAPFFVGHEELAATIVSIVLMSVFVNELTGPPVSKYAVVRGATL
jgi:NhaP-type Na+/H+ or K+/H+ antiporter